jgi:hypothetical protein
MIKFNCSSCQKKLGVPDEYAGRRVRCPKCEEPSIVPKVEATSAATSVTGSMADAVLSTSSSAPSETPVQIELQQIPENPNAKVLREIRRQQVSSRCSPESFASEDPSPKFERFGSLGFILNPIIRTVGSFPLAVIASVVVSAAVITVWNLIAVAVGTPLEVFYLVVPVAAGIGLCLVSEHRGLMMGLLSLFMGALALFAGRMTQVHLFTFPEWNRIVTADEIPSDRYKYYMMMRQLGGKKGNDLARKNIAEQDSEMPAIAICTLIKNKQLEASLGLELYFAAQTQMEQSNLPLATAAAETTFPQPDLAEAWPSVSELLQKWDTSDKRLEAVRGVYTRYLFFMEQARYKMLLDDYPRAITLGFFMCDGCIFMFLRLLYWIVGLFGAYKTCSVSFMD